VGKEVVAHRIHQKGIRQAAPFVTINCAGVPDSLLESSLFGHARGSFTGAYRDHPGLLRHAHSGTVFLDEVGEMSLRMQALLLRFLETGEVQTVGAASRANVDVRVIAATNRDLMQRVAGREFREDLYYRLNVLHVRIPPLRERSADIPLLLDHYGRVFAEQHQQRPPVLSEATIECLTAYTWPGNIRELKNVMERCVLRQGGHIIEPADLPVEIAATPEAPGSAPDGTMRLHQRRVDAAAAELFNEKQSFWATVYPRFMDRDLTRDDVRHFVRCGLTETHGSYRLLLSYFNLPGEDYKRFLAFLKQHDCHVPYRAFRPSGVMARSALRPPVTDRMSA